MNKNGPARLLGAVAPVFLVLFFFPSPARGQATAQKSAPGGAAAAERVAEENLAAARRNPLQLRHFLLGMPKGADLHYHLSGGVYAETLLQEAARAGLCVRVKESALLDCPAESGGKKTEPGECNESWKTQEIVPAAAVFCQPALYDALVDAFSMRGFVPSAGVTAHDHFFGAFEKFSVVEADHLGEWVDEAATRAAAQNEQYLELMETPDFSTVEKMASEVRWTSDFAELRKQFLDHHLRQNVDRAVAALDQAESRRRQIERCGQPQASEACKVEVRFLYQILRGKPKETVFAQALLGFEAAQADPGRIVGINFVMPEDGALAMNDYALQMEMVKYLHATYRNVHIALHAGELAYGLVPPAGLCCHIRLAVEAGAERIGHGVDVMYEDRPHELMKEMARRHVMVEINLTSNQEILGVSGKNHPLSLYQRFAVPVALSSDDEGISRIDLTNEYGKAVEIYGFGYRDLKKMARTGMEHAFLPGRSVWALPDVFSKAVSECAQDAVGAEKPSARCAEFLKGNEKAQQQWELERRFRAFETGL